MTITVPPTIAALPAPPDPANRSTFNALAYPWSVAQGVLAAEANEVATNVYNNALEVQSLAATAEASATLASSTANYVGDWAGLTGPLNIPASVFHSGASWMLVSSVADVTAHTPGVSAQWLRLSPEPVVAGGHTLLATVTPANGVTTCDITGLATSKMFLVVPQFHQGVGQFELSGADVIRTRISVDNGATWSSDQYSVSNNNQYPYVDIFYIFNTDTTNPKRVACMGLQAAQSKYFTDATVNAGTVNAIRLQTANGPTFTGIGSFKIYGVN